MRFVDTARPRSSAPGPSPHGNGHWRYRSPVRLPCSSPSFWLTPDETPSCCAQRRQDYRQDYPLNTTQRLQRPDLMVHAPAAATTPPTPPSLFSTLCSSRAPCRPIDTHPAEPAAYRAAARSRPGSRNRTGAAITTNPFFHRLRSGATICPRARRNYWCAGSSVQAMLPRES